MSDVCHNHQGHYRAKQQIFCNNVFAFIVIKTFLWLVDKLTLKFCKCGAVTEQTRSSCKIIHIRMKSILNNRINLPSITTVFQAIFFILDQVRTRPITLSSQMFCLVLWPCKYWHLNLPRYNLYILIAIWGWDDLHLVQHDNVRPEQMCLILCNTSQVHNSVKGISCHCGGRFTESTKITW
jgi:hypothetical protein